jgi:hypothetical protein
VAYEDESENGTWATPDAGSLDIWAERERLTELEAQLPGLRARVTAARAGGSGAWLGAEQANLARLLTQTANLCSAVEAGWGVDRAGAFREEARAVMDEALSTAPVDSSLYRNLTVTLAVWTGTDPRLQDDLATIDTAIGLLERALEPTAGSAVGERGAAWHDELWSEELADDTRADLATLLMERYGGPSEPDPAMLDRLIHHVELLVDTTVEIAEDVAAARRAHLGMAFAERSRGPEFRAPANRADRERALGLLRTALASPALDAEFAAEIRIDLAQLLFARYDAEQDEQDGPIDPAVADEILAVLGPVLEDDESPQLEEALGIAIMIYVFALDHAPTAENRASLVAWCRRALDVPGIEPQDADQYRIMLAEQLLDRADGEWPAPTSTSGSVPAPGHELVVARPDPAQDEAEAVRLFDRVVDGMRDEVPPTNAQLAALGAIVAFLWRTSPEKMDAGQLDRFIGYCDRLARVVPVDDPARGLVYAQLGVGLVARGMKFVQPHIGALLYDGTDREFRAMRQTPTLAQRAPGASADIERSISLLRTAVDLCAAGSDECIVAVVGLAMASLLKYVVQFPNGERALIREGVHAMRIAFEAASGAMTGLLGELKQMFIMALVYDLWRTEPFHSVPVTADGRPAIPDPATVPSVGQEADLLEELLRADLERSPRGAPQEPMFVLLSAFLAQMKGRRADFLAGMRQVADSASGFDEFTQWVPTMARYILAVERPGPGHTSGSESTGRADPPDPRGMTGVGAVFRATLEAAYQAAVANNERIPPDPGPEDFLSPAAPKRDRAAVVADPDAVLDVDPQAGPLIGDGIPYPFAEPVGRVFEVLDATAATATATGSADSPLGPVLPVTRALALQNRWLRERDPRDFGACVEQARLGAAAVDGHSDLGLRIDAFLSGLLSDRYALLGDRADLEAARRGFADLLNRSADVPHIASLPEVLALRCEAAGATEISALFRRTAPPAPSGERTEPTPSKSFFAEMLAALGEAELAGARGSAERAAAAARLEQAESLLPQGHPKLPAVRCELGLVEAERALRAKEPDTLSAAVHHVLEAAADCPADSPHRPALLLRAALVLGGFVTATALGSADQAAEFLDRGVALLDEAVDAGGHGYLGARARCRYGLGRMLHLRALRTGHPADLDRAIAALIDAWAEANPAPGDPFVIPVRRAMAEAYRAYGPGDAEHLRLAREAAASVLALHREAVLLQTGTRHGLEAARRAEADMMRLVRWCLDDAEWTQAARALERGRGLVLNAVTVAADVPARLRAADRADLADRWAEAEAKADAATGPRGPVDSAGLLGIPDDLRRHALQAFEGTDDESRLLSVPSADEIGAALRTVGADAFVYLIAGGPEEPGYALLVQDRSGETGETDKTGGHVIEALELPRLRAEPGGVLDRYAAALARRHASWVAEPARTSRGVSPRTLHRGRARDAVIDGDIETTATADEAWAEALEDLCLWAGEAAMGDVLGRVSPHVHGRDPRLVLASAGMLCLVPWHAARLVLPGRGELRMCQVATVSHCATGRQFADAAARPHPAPSGVEAMIVDPHGSRQMHREARAIRSAFYPRCPVVGNLPWSEQEHEPWTKPLQLAATAENVLPLLPGHGSSSAALLIANCHASVGTTAADSLLLVDSGEPPGTVTVEQLLASAHRRDPLAPGGLVMLVDCSSDLAMAQYDESVTLTTALLAAGAGAVVGARWPVDDNEATTALMFMFHHFLNGGGTPGTRPAGSAAEALRAAQCWMLDPDRRFPATPEGEALARRSAGYALSATRAWAAFTHHGR